MRALGRNRVDDSNYTSCLATTYHLSWTNIGFGKVNLTMKKTMNRRSGEGMCLDWVAAWDSMNAYAWVKRYAYLATSTLVSVPRCQRRVGTQITPLLMQIISRHRPGILGPNTFPQMLSWGHRNSFDGCCG